MKTGCHPSLFIFQYGGTRKEQREKKRAKGGNKGGNKGKKDFDTRGSPISSFSNLKAERKTKGENKG